MNNQWYISINGQTFGPYDLQTMHKLKLEGRLIQTNMVYYNNQWVQAFSVPELGFSSQGMNTNQPQHRSPKKKRGCLMAVLIFIGVLVAGTLLMSITPNRNSMYLGKRDKLLNEMIETTGGSLVYEDSNSLLNGLTINVPEGAYSDSVQFQVTSHEIITHDFGDYVNPITPLIEIENGGDYADQIITVKVPVTLTDDEFAMAFYYTEDDRIEALPLISYTNDEIVVATRHFSDIFVSKIDRETLQIVDIDTGYRPGVDDWSFPNYGSYASDGGYCLGATASSAYYYTELKASIPDPLHLYLDNNHESPTAEFDIDDSMGIRLASVVQEEYDSSSVYYEMMIQHVFKDKLLPDQFSYYSLVYGMLATKEPQIMGIFVRKDLKEGATIKKGHAILAYRILPEGIYVADPNRPGNEDLYVPYNQTTHTFGIYNSSTSVHTSKKDYNVFGHMAKSALVDWERIGNLFDEAAKAPSISTIGDEYFPKAEYKYAYIDTDGQLIWAEGVDWIEILPEEQSALRSLIENYKVSGYSLALPSDWATNDYMLLGVRDDSVKTTLMIFRDGKYKYYKKVEGLTPSSTYNKTGWSYIFVPVKNGMNDIGLYYSHKNGKNYDFIDFVRTDVIYGEEDLSGVWKGAIDIHSYEEGVTTFLEIMEKVKNNPNNMQNDGFEVFDESEWIRYIPTTLELSKIDKEKYYVKVSMITRGSTPSIFTTKGIYKNGVLSFKISEYGITMNYEYNLNKPSEMSGTFNVKILMKDMLNGTSNLSKE